MKTGICEQLMRAKSANEIEVLMHEAKNFQYASAQTRRRWERLKARRLAELAKA